MRKNFFLLLLLFGAMIFLLISCGDDDNPVNSGTPPSNVYLRFYDYLDLETGFIDSAGFSGTSDSTVDFWIAYNSNPPDFHGVIFHRTGREIAIIDSTKFNELSQAQIDSATYYMALQGDAFDTTKVILIKTNIGNVYKIGNPVEDSTGVAFDYKKVQ